MARSAASRHTSAAAREKKSVEKTPLALDRLIHERLTFGELKRLLQTTDGNLSVHARKLEDADYISCEKTFDDRVPRSEYRLTATGRRALDKYLAHMDAIIKAART